jgi:Lon protease-like protein
MSTPTDADELPLFPLQAVLFPGGLLGLKVFEARYLDLMARCLRERAPFGVVRLKTGTEVRKAGAAVAFEAIGTTAELLDVDSAQAGILRVRCRGGRRFEVHTSRQQADGLWLARTAPIEDDEVIEPPDASKAAVRALADAIQAIDAQGQQPFLLPPRFDDAGWVANRWSEILPIPMEARQRLMELRDPKLRLEVVDEFLRSKGVVAG